MSTRDDTTPTERAKREAVAEEARRLREQAAQERAAGNDGKAAQLLDRALGIYRESGDLRGVTEVMGELAPVGGVKGTSWPVALGFLVLLLAVAAGVMFLGIRLFADFLGDFPRNERQSPPEIVVEDEAVEPEPATTRLPAARGRVRVTASPQTCRVSGRETFSEVSMRVRLTATAPFEVVVLRGTLTARGGREVANGITPVTPVSRGTERVDMTFTIFEDAPAGPLTCGVEIQTAVPRL